MSRVRTVCCAFLTAVAAVAVPLITTSPAGAVTSATPASWTPDVTSPNAIVRELVQCGSTMYAVGSFSTVSQGGQTYTRDNAFSFDATTGAVTDWNPDANADVESVAVSADCTHVYLGGEFTKLGTTDARYLASVDSTEGTVDPIFSTDTNKFVHTLQLVAGGKQLIVGGDFTTLVGSHVPYLGSVDPQTGKRTTYMTVPVAGRLPKTSTTQVYNSQVSRTGRYLLIEGNFTTVNKYQRRQIAVLDLSATKATMGLFFSKTLNDTSCWDPFYGRTATFSPDEKTIYMAATGRSGTSPYCDAVTAFTNTAWSKTKWVNYTGRDSLYAVAASRYHVFIAGHERWANNPLGKDTCGKGCVERWGIADIASRWGTATTWNPSRSLGHGADDLLLTHAGLWVGSDTYYNSTRCAHAEHAGICFFPGSAA